ncbi:hypothetical protein ABPG74_001061 [Tetrahymena malaccensis]
MNQKLKNFSKLIAFIVCFSLFTSVASSRYYRHQNQLPDINHNPVIGIYAQPSWWDEYPRQYFQYVLNANIDWVQMSGAQTVIIPFDETQEYYDNLFSKINGVLFTGGDYNINIDVPIDKFQPQTGKNQWTQNAAYLLKKAVEANNNGDYFPVWGICQGFQLLHYIVSGFNYTILNHITNDFNFTRNANLLHLSQANLFSDFNNDWIDYSETKAPFLYLHELGITQQDYEYNPKLKEFFQILGVSANSTNIDAKDAFQYLAIVEAKNYPIAGVQFHPEYTIFQWGFNSNLEQKSLDIASYFSHYFISLARKNNHTFTSPQERNSYLSFNYPSAHIQGEIFDLITFIPRKVNSN